MKINIVIDDRLLEKAKQASGIDDLKILIEKALQLLIDLESK